MAATGLTVEGLADDARRPAAAGRTDRKSKIILLTSGTTGTPKGAKPASSGGASELQALLDRVPWRAEEATVIAAPMFHAWGYSQLLISALMACTIVTRRRFDPEATLQLIDRHQRDRAGGGAGDVRPHHGIARRRAKPLQRLRSLRFVTASGSRMRPDVVIKFMDQFGDVIYNNYNATEAGMIATATPARPSARRPTPPESRSTAPRSGSWTRTATSCPSAKSDRSTCEAAPFSTATPRATTKNFHDGFMASGDVGYSTRQVGMFVVGRDDEMIVSGGENVYPIEVEKMLVSHPEVAEAAVIGVDDEQYGQRLAAFVVLEKGAGATPDALKQHVRDNLANYKVPRDISVLDELPRGSTGKILRKELRVARCSWGRRTRVGLASRGAGAIAVSTVVGSPENPAACRISLNAWIIASVASCASSKVWSSESTAMSTWST